MPSSRSQPEGITRPATLEHLPSLLAFLDGAVEEAGLGEDLLFALHLAVEEACTNVITHGYADAAPGPLTLRVAVGPEAVVVTLLDVAPPFDPADAPRPALDESVERRRTGGLGWHFIRAMMDDIRHEVCPEGGNLLTLVKNRPPAPMGSPNT